LAVTTNRLAARKGRRTPASVAYVTCASIVGVNLFVEICHVSQDEIKTLRLVPFARRATAFIRVAIVKKHMAFLAIAP
jgi:hypothetical protein